MSDRIRSDDVRTLDDLRSALLRDRPGALRPDQGTEAFRHHKLLAAAVHRASRLDARSGESETDAWVRYVREHFPSGRNEEGDARLLFAQWRTALLKDDAPGPQVPITHGQPTAHWQRDKDGRLCLNLEDMWADFEESVDHFIAYLRATPERRAVALRRWRETDWSVQSFEPVVAGAGATAMRASISTTSTPVTGTGR
jgi:hypothetical protein